MNKKIENVDDFNDYATEIWEQYLQTFSKINGLIRDIGEDDIIEDNWTFCYTDRGMKLADRMKGRLISIGIKYFPADDIEIESFLYQEA